MLLEGVKRRWNEWVALNILSVDCFERCFVVGRRDDVQEKFDRETFTPSGRLLALRAKVMKVRYGSTVQTEMSVANLERAEDPENDPSRIFG
jgi:hypothetical protein